MTDPALTDSDLLPFDGPVTMALAAAPAPLPGETPFWFLQGAGAGGVGLVAAWALALGRGVRIGVLDSGVNLAHADFNPVRLALDAGTGSITDPHGTRVAGLISGRIDNAIGGLGGATGAELHASQLDFSAQLGPAAVAPMLLGQAAMDVSNNSWGWSRAFGDNFRLNAYQGVAQALVEAAEQGRGGLGTVWVFAGGNGRLTLSGQNHGDDSNFHNLTNARQTIAVGATDATGRVASFSSPGTNLLLVAPGQALATADGLSAGAAGRIWVSGTSFAAPLVSSTVALMLEVNPGLGYRDVQQILAITARPVAGAPGTANAGYAVNGGGLQHSRDAGFGLLDAEAAVRLARHHAGGATAANEASVVALADLTDADPDPAVYRLTFAVTAPEGGLRVEWAELALTLTDASLRTLSVELISPSGTRALIAPNFTALGNGTQLAFDFTSAATWGEAAEGTWHVDLRQAKAGAAPTVQAAGLRLFGAAGGDDGQRWFTDAWAALAKADPGRQTIDHSAEAPGLLNFAAARGAVHLDLGAGTGSLGGVGFQLASAFDRAIGGAGNDRLTGSTAAEALWGDDGHDILSGGGGADTLRGGAGRDTLQGGGGNDLLEGGADDDRIYGHAGRDTLIGGAGRDVMTGGPGADVFVFRPGDVPTEGAPDRITDFDPGFDRLDLSALEAMPRYIGTARLSGQAGEFRLAPALGALQFDLNGDGLIDLRVDLTDMAAFAALDPAGLFL
ncbi:MAG: S8 family serine peptidase [Gemmobacter sp.]